MVWLSVIPTKKLLMVVDLYDNEPVLTQPTQQTLDTIQDFLCELGMRVHTVNYNMSRFTLAKTEMIYPNNVRA